MFGILCLFSLLCLNFCFPCERLATYHGTWRADSFLSSFPFHPGNSTEIVRLENVQQKTLLLVMSAWRILLFPTHAARKCCFALLTVGRNSEEWKRKRNFPRRSPGLLYGAGAAPSAKLCFRSGSQVTMLVFREVCNCCLGDQRVCGNVSRCGCQWV